MRKLIPIEEAKQKGNLLASLAGFLAYTIGIDRPIRKPLVV
jgi:hypothetical protein